MKVLSVLCALVFACAESWAQDAGIPQTRAEQIEQDQADKALALSPDVPDRTERRVNKIQKTVENIFKDAPVHLQVGGLPMESGFAAGPIRQWTNSTGHVRSTMWAVGSVYKSYSTGVNLELPRITRQFGLMVQASRRDLTRVDYYGEGPTSLRSDRSNFRKEDTMLDLRLAWPLSSHFSPNCGVQQNFLHVGPGTHDGIASTTVKFGPAQAPGIDQQSSYLIADCSLPLDFRDNPAFPHKGTALFLRGGRYRAADFSRYSFYRVSGSAEEYIPFFNEKRVIALHAGTNLSFHNENQLVPFYMQPTLGGYDDLRGFRPYRFYDENSFILNAEYRWEICTGFDMAVFEDAGEVFHRPGQIDLSNLRKSTGFGFRFNDQRSMVMRMDVGFSRERFQVWFTFDKVF
jgi:hypothetical protein